MRHLGVDLAWGTVNETGVVALEADGRVVAAAWTTGVEETADWLFDHAGEACLAFVDAPLLVLNEAGQRRCEGDVGRRYGRWKVSANSTNRGSPRLAGVALRERLEARGWRYDDGTGGPPASGRRLSECYPYTTLVGAPELGYETERPRYKRMPRGAAAADWRPERARHCDELIRRVAALATADPPLHLASHPETRALVDTPSPLLPDRAYKHREDLLDACLCAWTAALWARHGDRRCVVLGRDDPLVDAGGRRATIIAPARAEQREGAP